MCRFLLHAVVFGYLTTILAHAFPPSPGYTVYGLVRDQFGWVVDSSDATIIFKSAADQSVIVRSKIQSNALISENYRVMIPLDENRSGTPYKDAALVSETPFVIEVLINGVAYFPTQTAVTPIEGVEAAKFLHLDLTLGDDSDGDGLPDLWEQWQLQAAGLDQAQLDLLNPDDDIDGDGLTNRGEYIAGTFAYLGQDSLSIEVKEHHADDWSTLEFLAVVDKTYTLERSINLRDWQPVRFGLWDDRATLQSDWKAADTVRQRIQAAPPETPGGRWFYQLGVR